MFIRPTSIITHSLIEQDLRQFTHTLNQEQITDTDSIIPITHKGQLTQINRKDLSDGMSPWSAYYRDWLIGFTLDLDYLCQGITWYREVDDDGVLHSYWFKGSAGQSEYYNELLAHFGTGLRCEAVGRYIQINKSSMAMSPLSRGDGGTSEGFIKRESLDCHVVPPRNDENMEISDDAKVQATANTREGATQVVQSLSRFLGLLLLYGNIQQTNGVCTALKINLPITGYTRSQLAMIQEDCALLRTQGLFVHWYLVGTGMKQNLELVTNDSELLQLLLPHLQYIDSEVTMTTFDTLQSRSAQVIAGGLDQIPLIAKPRTLS